MQRGRRVGECWRQLPRCCRINFGGPQTQTVSVDSIERFYRCPFLLSPPRRASRSHPSSAHPSRSFAWINSSVFSFSLLLPRRPDRGIISPRCVRFASSRCSFIVQRKVYEISLLSLSLYYIYSFSLIELLIRGEQMTQSRR
jgi:hypothetical protein